MKVTQVAIRPSQASDAAGRPSLTPELLAATGARYSRNNEGLEAIISKINPANPDASVDSIFRMVDYGHQSILDMVPVAMFIDDISIWLAYYIWSLCPTAGGQESSTRYIKISPDSVISPGILGIPTEQIGDWGKLMDRAFESYSTALNFWEAIAKKNPEVTKIPSSLFAENSESSRKKVGRMLRNYAFDRARYFLPLAAATNIMLSMSARGWVQLCQYLLSSPLTEPKLLGEKIKQELSLSTSRMLKHAVEKHQLCKVYRKSLRT
ncbi:MAG: FAD-dependent thymidylate synthase [Pseudanabaena sp. RU_4_16]|nr:FAD-dependent thymidylate synthase [Pseudanabaena sp. RU_4_16]